MQDYYYKFWKDLIAPENVEIERESRSKFFCKFVLRPLEKGYGITIGNALRRVLLNSMMGAAISGVKFEETSHEFSHFEGVVEDVVDIILNLKGVRIQVSDPNPVILTLEKKGPGVVTAGDIKLNEKVRIVNPEHIIANVSSERNFKCDLFVSYGRGYVLAEEQSFSDLGWIAVDSLFSPVEQVNYSVSNVRVGQKTDYDALTLEVWTNGTLEPEHALSLGAKILSEQLSVFKQLGDYREPSAAVSDEQSEQFNDNLFRPVEDLELSVRSANCLKNANIRFIGELVTKSEAEMLRTKNFGRKSLNEIKEILSQMGLSLGMKVQGWPPTGWDPANFSSPGKNNTN